jgi:hypothetical protein
VRLRINSRSNSARPPKTVSISRAMRRGGVGPGIAQRLKAGTLVGDSAEQVAGRTGQPIKTSDHQDVAATETGDQAGQLLPIRLRPADLLLEDLSAAGGLQLGYLRR